jgi:hypothetical protein
MLRKGDVLTRLREYQSYREQAARYERAGEKAKKSPVDDC